MKVTNRNKKDVNKINRKINKRHIARFHVPLGSSDVVTGTRPKLVTHGLTRQKTTSNVAHRHSKSNQWRATWSSRECCFANFLTNNNVNDTEANKTVHHGIFKR